MSKDNNLEVVRLIESKDKTQGLFHVSYLINDNQVLFTESSLVSDELAWNLTTLKEYFDDFRYSYYNDGKFVKYISEEYEEDVNELIKQKE